MNTKDFETVSRRDYEAALERAEKAERELAEVRRAAKSCIADAQTEKDMAIAELERVQKSAAEMRAVLEWMWREGEMGYIERPGLPKECGECGRAGGHSGECWQAQLERGLSSDAGRDYHHADEFGPLVDVIESAVNTCTWLLDEANNLPFPDGRKKLWATRTLANKALTAARQKGLIP